MYHLGFSDRHYGFPRFYNYRSCSGTACTPAYSSYATAANHYSDVLKVMTGSIENGIDPNYPNTVDQRRRSGIVPEAYWSIMAPVNLTCSAWIAAVQEAQTTSMDVVNSSDGWDNKCSNTYDCGGLNTALKNAVDAGVVFTASMGNRGDGGGTTCNSAYPAQRRDVLGIGALDTTSTATNYDTTGAASYTSRGGVDITINGVTHSKALAIADLSAPGDYSYYYNTPTNGYGYATMRGTSFSAPSVGGAVALLRQSFRALGFGSTADNARAVMANMLLMGDGYSYDAGGDRYRQFDHRTGAGRTHMHFFSGANLTGPWGWGWHKVTISQGSDVVFQVWDSGPESPSIKQWKVAMTWPEPDNTHAADIDLKVYDHCPPGGGSVLIASQTDYDVRNRIELSQAQISNKCLEYHVIGYTVSGTRTVYVADYFHSGNPADH